MSEADWRAMAQERKGDRVETLYFCEARKELCYAAEVIDAGTEKSVLWSTHSSLADAMSAAMSTREESDA